jgi:hypothetical protein
LFFVLTGQRVQLALTPQIDTLRKKREEEEAEGERNQRGGKKNEKEQKISRKKKEEKQQRTREEEGERERRTFKQLPYPLVTRFCFSPTRREDGVTSVIPMEKPRLPIQRADKRARRFMHLAAM